MSAYGRRDGPQMRNPDPLQLGQVSLARYATDTLHEELSKPSNEAHKFKTAAIKSSGKARIHGFTRPAQRTMPAVRRRLEGKLHKTYVLSRSNQ